MNLQDSLRLGRDLMDAHGLQGWTLRLDRARRRTGCCRFATKTIGMSRAHVLLNDAAVIRQTVLHEIAHALVGPEHGHDWAWQAKAREIGALAIRCSHPDSIKAPARWRRRCALCGYTNPLYRKPQPRRSQVACGECCRKFNGGRFAQQFVLIEEEVSA